MENHLYLTALSPAFLAMNSGHRSFGTRKKRRIPMRLKNAWQSASLKAVGSISSEKAAMREVVVVPRLLPRVMG